jgi:selenium donor protein
MNSNEPRLTSLSHGGGCGCKIAPAVLSEILKSTTQMPIPKELMVGIATADDAAVYKLNDHQALIATTDFFMPIVDDPYEFGRIAATNAISVACPSACCQQALSEKFLPVEHRSATQPVSQSQEDTPLIQLNPSMGWLS